MSIHLKVSTNQICSVDGTSPGSYDVMVNKVHHSSPEILTPAEKHCSINVFVIESGINTTIKPNCGLTFIVCVLYEVICLYSIIVSDVKPPYQQFLQS